VVLTALSTGVTRTWTGAGTTNNWTVAANWQGGVAPKAGDDLVFPAGAARITNVNNYAAGTPFHSMSFSARYDVTGNGILLGGKGGGMNVAYPPEFSFSLGLLAPIVNAGGSFTVADGDTLATGPIDLAGHDLGLYGQGGVGVTGPLTGAGKISDFLGSGLFLNSGSTDAGTFDVHGPLEVNGSYGLRSVTMNDSSSNPILRGGGTAGPVTAGAGTVSPFSTFTVNGRLSMTGATTYEAHVGDQSSRVAVKGPVVLGGAVLRVVPTSNIPLGNDFTIVSNQGGAAVSGTFAGLPEGATVVDTGSPANIYRISYKGGASGRDVTLSPLFNGLGPEADLAVTQTASPDPVAKGDKARFDITAANNGPVATKVTLHDRVPEGTTLVSLSQLAGWSCRTGTGAAGQGINCTSDAELAPGSSQTFSLVVRVNADPGPTVTNKATVSGDVADPNPDNNTSTATIAVT